MDNSSNNQLSIQDLEGAAILFRLANSHPNPPVDERTDRSIEDAQLLLHFASCHRVGAGERRAVASADVEDAT